MEDASKAQDAPCSAGSHVTIHTIDTHPQTAPTAVMQPQATASTTLPLENPQISTSSTLLGASLFANKRMNPPGAPATARPESPQQEAFRRSSQKQTYMHGSSEAAADLKAEDIKEEDVDERSTAHAEERIFVSQNENEPPTTTTANAHLKREASALPVAAVAPKKLAKKGKNLVDGYDDSIERHHSNLAVDKTCFKDAVRLFDQAIKLLLANIENIRSKHGDEPEARSLQARVREASSIVQRFIPIFTIGYVGETESGKSSIINALMNKDEVAVACDTGKSGTHVVHEYVEREESQKTEFRAVIHYHPFGKIERLTREHFTSYYEYNNCDKDDIDADSLDELRTKSNTALEFFTSLLAGEGPEPNFGSQQEVEKYLAQAEHADDRDLLEELDSGIKAYLASLNIDKGATVIDENTFQVLNRRKRNFAGPPKEEDGLVRTPWRLVRKISVHLSARILEEGLRLADLPGLSDSDQTRVRNARDYINLCSKIVITHPVGRIADRDSVEKLLSYFIRSGRASSTIVVCTKTDDFEHDRERDYTKEEDNYLSPFIEAEGRISQEIRSLEAQLRAMDSDDDDDDDDASAASFRRVTKMLEKKRLEQAALTASYQGACITIRNNNTAEKLHQKIRAMSQQLTGEETDMPIFCVSSKVYKTHRKGYNKQDPPYLDIEQVGVKALREYLVEAPGKMKHEKLRQAVRNTTRAILGLELYCSRTPLERKQEMMPLVTEPMGQFDTRMKDSITEIVSIFNSSMMHLLFTKEVAWMKEGAAKADKWAKIHHSRYRQFCRKHGLHVMETKGKPFDWNESIISVMAETLVPAFTILTRSLNEQQANLQSLLDGLLLKAKGDLQDSAAAFGMEGAMTVFYESVENKRQILSGQINDLFHDLTQDLLSIRRAAISHDNADRSYILKAMDATYDSCAKMTGSASHARRNDAIKAKLTGDSNVFKDVIDLAIADFKDCLGKWEKRASSKLGKLFKEVVLDFNSRFNNEEAETEERKVMRAELLEAVHKARSIIDGPLQVELDECKKYK